MSQQQFERDLGLSVQSLNIPSVCSHSPKACSTFRHWILQKIRSIKVGLLEGLRARLSL